MSADVAAELDRVGYAGLFQTGDDRLTADLYANHREALHALVRDGDDRVRLLAAEVLSAHGDDPPASAELYARALQLTGEHVFPANAWGTLWASPGYDGPLGEHLLAQGDAAIEPLKLLLDDETRLFYEGSKEAMVGNRHAFRVKDAAAYFIGRLTGREIPFHEDPTDRDAEIALL
jgi:hypothetical protein